MHTDSQVTPPDASTELVGGPGGQAGLITQPQAHLPPALLAEQQRAKSEIEAALTYAAARPRDEKQSLDKILNSCQRVGLAANAEYQYSRGGTDIVGATIDLMEVVAMHWGNLEYGFRELARYPGEGGKPGESIVEAYAWDLQGNTKRRTQFTVKHAIGRRSGGDKVLTDARDVYELVANQAQRRVRVCLENIIPRDIVEEAREQCQSTLQAKDPVTPEKIEAMLKWFGEHGVSKEAVEVRIQRRMDAITPAQLQAMRRIVRSIKDGLSEPKDWFDLDVEPEQSAADKAKAAMRKTAEKKPAAKPKPEAPPEAPPEALPETATPPVNIMAEYEVALEAAATIRDVQTVREQIEKDFMGLTDDDKKALLVYAAARDQEIRSERGESSNAE